MPSLPATVRDLASQENFDWLGARVGGRAFGKVTALPGNPAVGDTCFYRAAEGIYWHLVYTNESAEYPWNKIGGPPLLKRDAAGSRTTKSKTFQTTGAPSVTAPLKMVGICRYGVASAQLVPATLTGMINAIFVGEVQTHTTEEVQTTAFATVPIHTVVDELSLAKGAVVQNRYKNAQENEVVYRELFVEIDPVKVG